MDAAHDRRMRIIALSGHISNQLAEEDVELRVPNWMNARIQETHMTIVHALCDLVDRHLLGQED